MFHNMKSAFLVAITCCTWLLGSPVAGYTVNSGTSGCRQCKSIPGDRKWPTTVEWDKLNATVDGRLIATLPIAHVCHAPWYSKEACEALRSKWGVAELQTSQPAEFLAPWFQNQSCTPFGGEKSACDLGNYASYSINVTGSKDIIAGVKFAKEKNIRLVVKNTGHDLQGKSTGKGALSLWTHNMRDANLITNYRSKYYNGPAIKFGAGVQIAQAVNRSCWRLLSRRRLRAAREPFTD
ncbi:hypothetical protein NUW58_g9061 [Xylaria curta]|uniref:Uncharacterized protein n=1 Tax=Xylaria curta TaxID=42375 RepID=A0ACC1N1M7_9PEZI|nr:hypothetical protein NUW58_g9061 [Xylaria curta]